MYKYNATIAQTMNKIIDAEIIHLDDASIIKYQSIKFRVWTAYR